jgi:hypothetical protein
VRFDADLSPVNQFLSTLIEEFFDEWGLYVVHHKRWTDKNNRKIWDGAVKRPELGPGGLIAYHENQHVPMPGLIRSQIAQWFNHRQTRRLPYFLSVGPEDSARTGFPETRTLLDQSFERMLTALELIFGDPDCHSVLASLGVNKMTKADASAFGQFNMLAHHDVGTRARMAALAPNFVRWLDERQLAVQKHIRQVPFEVNETPRVAEERVRSRTCDAAKGLRLLLEEVTGMFVPLQQANRVAFEAYQARGQSEFNESAMWKGQALFRSTLHGLEYVMVAKSFQYKVWRALLAEFASLSPSDQAFVQQTGFRLVDAEQIPVQLVQGLHGSKL